MAGLGRAGQGAGRAPCAAGEQAGSFRAEKDLVASFRARWVRPGPSGRALERAGGGGDSLGRAPPLFACRLGRPSRPRRPERPGTCALLHAEPWAAAAGSRPGWGGAASRRSLGTKCPGLRAREAGERKSWGRWRTLAAAARYSEWNQVGNAVALLFVLAVPLEPAWWP